MSDEPRSSSPLAAKNSRNRQRSHTSRSRAEDESEEIESVTETSEEEPNDDHYDDIEDGSDDEWKGVEASPQPKPKAPHGKKAAARTDKARAEPALKAKDQVARLVEKTERLTIGHEDEGADSDDSVVVRPSRKTRTSIASVASADIPGGEAKKKKR